MNAPLRISVFSALLFAAACSDGPSVDEAQRFCSKFCAKIVTECHIPFAPSEAQCTSQCTSRSQSGSGTNTCNPTTAEVDACFTALDRAECSAFTSGDGVPECELCGANNNDNDGGVNKDAGLQASCVELNLCCPKTPAGTLRQSCETAVTSNIATICAQYNLSFIAYCGNFDAGFEDSGVEDDAGVVDSGVEADAGEAPDSGSVGTDAAIGADCTALSACCATLQAPYKDPCNTIVQSNFAQACSAALTNFKQQNLCQ